MYTESSVWSSYAHACTPRVICICAHTHACTYAHVHTVHVQELSMHGRKLGVQAEPIRQAGAGGNHKQNIERDCMRALNGVLDLVSWLGLDL